MLTLLHTKFEIKIQKNVYLLKALNKMIMNL